VQLNVTTIIADQKHEQLSPLDGVGSGTPSSRRAYAKLLARLALANKP
jgi:hypothetical protein